MLHLGGRHSPVHVSGRSPCVAGTVHKRWPGVRGGGGQASLRGVRKRLWLMHRVGVLVAVMVLLVATYAKMHSILCSISMRSMIYKNTYSYLLPILNVFSFY